MTDIPLWRGGSRPETHTRSPATAALVSFLVPGLGHVYAGRPARGLAVVLGVLACAVAILQLTMVVPARGLRILLLLLLPLGIVAVMVDAARVAWRVREGYVLRRWNRWYVYALLVVLSSVLSPFVIGAINRSVAHAFRLPGTSMEPTLLPGDYIMMSPRLPAAICRGDLVVYRDAAGQTYLHRVAAVPGDEVAMRHKVLWRNGRPVREPFAVNMDSMGNPGSEEMAWQLAFLANTAAARGYAPTRDDWGPLRVPAGRYLVLGDNRVNSYDGRWKGFVPREAMIGRPAWIYFSRAPGGPIRWGRIGAAVR